MTSEEKHAEEELGEQDNETEEEDNETEEEDSSEEDDEDIQDDDFHMLTLNEEPQTMFPRALARRFFQSLEQASSPTMVHTIDRTWQKAGVDTERLCAWVVRCCYGGGQVSGHNPDPIGNFCALLLSEKKYSWAAGGATTTKGRQ